MTELWYGGELSASDVERYLGRIGLEDSDGSLTTLHRAHVRNVPFENLDIPLGRPVRLDVPSLFDKIVVRRRGGYCFELNALYAALLEQLGHTVSRRLGRVRMRDQVSPRAATHMTLVVDDHVVDVGFGAANPLGPVPLGGEATFGRFTWRTERVTSPEAEDVWLVSLADMPLYTFNDVPAHPVDYLAPNHFTQSHELSSFTNVVMAQRWDENDVQIGMVGYELLERRPEGDVATTIDASDYGRVLHERFGLALSDEDVDRLVACIRR